MGNRLTKSALSGPLGPVRATLAVAFSSAAVFLAAAPTAEAAGGLKATLSLPFGGCSVVMETTWSHPKPGQDHLSMQVFDTTTTHLSAPFATPVGSADTAQVHTFPALSGGPDVWIGKAFLFDANNQLLAKTTSKRYTFNCTL